ELGPVFGSESGGLVEADLSCVALGEKRTPPRGPHGARGWHGARRGLRRHLGLDFGTLPSLRQLGNRMIRILDRLVAKTFLKFFVIFLLATPPLFVVGDITENLTDYLRRGLTWTEVAGAYVYQMPQFILWAFPIAALVAAVFTIHGMTTHREIVAAKAGGISFHRLVVPLLAVGTLLVIAALGLTEVVPQANRRASQILRDEDPRRNWRADFVYRSESGLTWQIDRLTAGDSRMSGVIIERPPSDGKSGIHVTAATALYDSVSGWTFQRGMYRQLRPDSTERAFEYMQLRMTGIDEMPDELLEIPREPEEMTYGEIDRLARIIQRTGGNAKGLLVKREQKLAIPLAALVVILMGAPLATSNQRGGTAYGVGASLSAVILYLLIFKISGALGEAGTLEPLTAAWLPNVLFLIGGIVLLVRVRT
ncbi:MAG: YjgP/YjgQ family permease, partial [Gemmatimonadales bacterium]|nr:YjgP/YjgQ family permease [Gemmatimonadales bacterium]